MWGLDVTSGDITDGPIAATLVALSVPLVLQNLVHVCNQLVDTFWLGRVGETAVAAVGLDFPVLAIMFGVAASATVGTQILVAQRVGTGAEADARRMAFNGLALSFVLGLAILTVVAVGGDELVRLLGAGPEIAPLATAYLLVLAAFFPLATSSDAVERGFIGWGDARSALYINLATVATNVALDPFLILGYGPIPAYGVRGAALATGVGYAIGLLVALVLASGRRESLQLSLRDAHLSPGDLRELVDVGAPVSGQRLAGQSSRVAVIAVVATVGGAAGLAAYTVGARVATVAFLPATGIGSAAQSMVGQNLGAGRPDRAHSTIRSGVGIASGVLLLVGVGQWLAPGPLATLFVPTATELGFALTVEYLEILAYGYWAMGVTAVVLAAFNGASRTRTGFVVDILKYWGVRIPAAVAALPAATITVVGLSIGGLGLGVQAVFWAVTVSNVLTAVGIGGYYLWQHEAVFDDAASETARSIPVD